MVKTVVAVIAKSEKVATYTYMGMSKFGVTFTRVDSEAWDGPSLVVPVVTPQTDEGRVAVLQLDMTFGYLGPSPHAVTPQTDEERVAGQARIDALWVLERKRWEARHAPSPLEAKTVIVDKEKAKWVGAGVTNTSLK